jgi:LysM repeat protein
VRIIRKPLKVTPRKKLRSAAQRAAKYAEEDSAEEPNVKLSRAFVVVLLLHIVAVGGIFAFSALKDHQTSNAAAKPETSNQKGTVAQGNAARGSGTADKASGKTVPADVQKLVEAAHGSGSGGAKSQSSLAPEGSGDTVKTYVVQKGDSPAGIAKKFKVSYADLLRTNNIEDPKKLQIGQKLLIPNHG